MVKMHAWMLMYRVLMTIYESKSLSGIKRYNFYIYASTYFLLNYIAITQSNKILEVKIKDDV